LSKSFPAFVVLIALTRVSICFCLPQIPGWLAGDAHMHSTYSDGSTSIAVMAARAKELGWQWIYMTDHAPYFFLRNWTSYVRECELSSDEIFVLAGSEFGLTNHYLGYGLDHFQPTIIDSCQGLIDFVADLGGFGYIAHPTSSTLGWDDLQVTGYTGIEVWNGNTGCEYLWDELLRQGRKVLGISNSDAHSPAALGNPFLYLKASLDKEEILTSLRTGKLIMSRGPFLNFEIGHYELGETAGIPQRCREVSLKVEWLGEEKLKQINILRVDPEEVWTVATIDTSLIQSPVELVVPVGNTTICFRLQGVDSNGKVMVLTNPIWIQFLPEGDINEDSLVNILDVILCLRLVLQKPALVKGKIYYPAYPDWLLQRADADTNGVIDISDVIFLLQRARNK